MRLVRFVNMETVMAAMAHARLCQLRIGLVNTIMEDSAMTSDERTVYVFALRYALPRHTYALSIVSREILSRLDAFEDGVIEGMIRDCWIYYPSLDCGGDIDRKNADALKDKLMTELAKRGRDDLLSRLKDEAERRGL
jgi:hypothetical protein